MSGPYAKHFIPLESNPEVFNELIKHLGASDEIEFRDVFTLDEPELLPRPALAVILVFPTTDSYNARNALLESARVEYQGSGDGEPIVWLKQTINNACGLYAILHALSNGLVRTFIKPNSLLEHLLRDCILRDPQERAKILEASTELEQAHAAVAAKGETAAPDSAEDEVDFHYICFVRSGKDGHLYELDGDSKGPIDTGVTLEAGQDLLCAEVLAVMRNYIDQEEDSIGFNIMALVKTGG
ncbi:ubiquitin carboxyl-terminal hydrolase, family 1 [Podospora didyma]|uniref:Ubiquitin carboxyl-terminal hydrolase n=1 Tax=Podospora didyma TaxID=330526 RepID=A0AAE0N452_9PEZI|nr:ubiquitin carboxyl-terminal hydrolase, family 1 [Podospora didyma]